MRKTINIPEEKFRRVLKEIVSGEYADDNQDPFASQKGEENHDQAITDTNIDPTAYRPNDNIAIENP